MSCDTTNRTLFNLSSAFAEPLCQAFRYLRFRMIAPLDPSKFENRSSILEEVAFRALVGLSSLFAFAMAPFTLIGMGAVLGIGHKLLRYGAYEFQKSGYTHVRGSAPEKNFGADSSEMKILSWNHCGPGGGMSLDHGGVVDWRYRIDAIALQIEQEDPDVLVLQEYYDTAFTEALIARLESKYAHFFTHLGQNVIGSESGIMVLSKAAVHKFSYTAFNNNHWTLNRGFAAIEIKQSAEASEPFCRILGTHLIHGDAPEDRVSRLAQVAQIVEGIRSQKKSIPTFLAGDLNIERDGSEGQILTPYFRHGYLGEKATCTNRLVAQWDLEAKGTWGETIDYISLYEDKSAEGVELIDCHLVRAFDETYNTKTARSDHHGVALTVRF